MSVDNELLRKGIIEKLKEYDAYIDNELPDYIMVMLANNKTLLQVNSDLRLFLGDNTDRFTTWLHSCLKSPSLLELTTGDGGEGGDGGEEGEDILELMAEEDMVSDKELEEEKAALGKKRKRLSKEEVASPTKVLKTSTDESQANRGSGNRTRSQRVKSANEEEGQRSRTRVMQVPDSSRDVDLRELLSKRRQHNKGAEPSEGGEDSDGGEGGEGYTVPSVVRVVERPKLSSRGGGGRLLKMAIAGLGGSPSQRGRRGEGGRAVTGEVKKSVVVASSTKKPLDAKAVTKLPATSSDEPSVEVGGGEGVEGEEEEEEEELTLAEHIERSTLAAVQTIIPGLAGVVSNTRAQDLRELINRNREDKQIESTRFVVTLPPAAGTELAAAATAAGEEEEVLMKLGDSEDTQDSSEDPGRTTVPERCRFWPNCKNGDSCSYHHPSVPCKLFPVCKYGSKCLFVHPQCKYDSRCTRPDCSYLHTSPRRMPYQQQQQQQHQPPPVPMATMFPPQPPVFAPSTFSYVPGGPSPQWPRPPSRSPRFPKKSALTWTPTKHISERAFAVPDKQSTSLPAKQ